MKVQFDKLTIQLQIFEGSRVLSIYINLMLNLENPQSFDIYIELTFVIHKSTPIFLRKNYFKGNTFTIEFAVIYSNQMSWLTHEKMFNLILRKQFLIYIFAAFKGDKR